MPPFPSPQKNFATVFNIDDAIVTNLDPNLAPPIFFLATRQVTTAYSEQFVIDFSHNTQAYTLLNLTIYRIVEGVKGELVFID